MGIFQLLVECVELIEVMLVFIEAYAWHRSKPERQARRESQSHGQPQLAIGKWSRLAYSLLPIIAILFIIIVWKWIS